MPVRLDSTQIASVSPSPCAAGAQAAKLDTKSKEKSTAIVNVSEKP